MSFNSDNLFESHPDPMWVYDRNTLQFLAVNTAAVAKYGYSRDEFLAMTIGDIRPAEGIDALRISVDALAEGRDEAGVWRHRLKSGAIIYADITDFKIEYAGRSAGMISARDVSRIVMAEQTAQQALERERVARRSSDALALQFQIMFDSVPGMFLVFAPTSYDVVAVSEAYLNLVATQRSNIVGRNLFDVLLLQPQDNTHSNLRRSFDRILATKKPDLLDFQQFVLPNAEERYWAVSSTPVVGPDEKLLLIILRMQDVTDALNSSGADLADDDDGVLASARIDLVVHTSELKSDNILLSEMASKLRTTQRLLGTGTWSYYLAEDRIEWSTAVYAMYEMTPELFGHSFEDYVALVHVDDRKSMRENFAAFITSGNAHFSFAHRIMTPTGRIVHIRGEAEKLETATGPVLRGVSQDVTRTAEANAALARATRLLEIAGSSAKFGAWVYDLHDEKPIWSAQTALIHDEPEGFSPETAEEALAYVMAEYRDRVEGLLWNCLDHGEPFDVTCGITTAKQRKLWVRMTGEVERDDTDRIISMHGSFQDITELVTARRKAEENEKLLEIAGEVAKLGGWRVNLLDESVTWTDSIAQIHELPPGTHPTIAGGISYFAPEEWESARKVFHDCARYGTSFDNLRNLITAKGNRVKVRSMGVAVRDQDGRIVAVQGAMQDVSELAKAQRDAQALGERLAQTLENIGDAFFTLDLDWRFTYLNSRAETLLERDRSALIGQKVFDAFPEARGTEVDILYKRALETGETIRFEQMFPPLNRLFRVNAHPTADGLAVYFSDIGGERRREEHLRLLDAAINRINDMVVITETETVPTGKFSKIVYVNDAFERVTGYTPAEAIGNSPSIMQGPRTQQSEVERMRNAVETQSPVRAELINYTKSGLAYWLELDIMPIANDAGQVTHFVAVQRDITVRRRIEETLRMSETRFRFIAKATGQAVWEWNIAEGHVWWSDGMRELFGHLPDPAVKVPSVWRANVHPDDERRIDEMQDQLLSGQRTSVNLEYRFRRADGTWANVRGRSYLLRDEEGRGIRIIGSIMDISEQREMEERLRQSQKLEAVGQLTGGVAHDFNNLLTIIIGNTELLQDNLPDDDPLRQYADMCALAADRAAELTSRLLAFSRKQALQPRVVTVNAIIGGIEDMLRRTLGEDIDIQIVLDPALWRVEVDPGQLEAVLLNLAINARDAMPGGGSLTIETANVCLDEGYVSIEPDLTPGLYVVIAVSDTGHGIAKEHLDRVYEPFFTTKPVGKGTGLGLSMAFGFVKQTGGHMRIYSEVNEGTTVKLYFPRLSSDQEADKPIEQSQVLRGVETILVVEDDNLIQQQLVVQLAGLGYRVVSASAGAAALDILRERSDIDLLLTDVVLPGGMNGRQTAEFSKQIRPRLKVLYTSGYSENAIVHHGRVDQGLELLSKPYRRSELAFKVRKVLDS